MVSHFMDTTDQTHSLGECENYASTLAMFEVVFLNSKSPRDLCNAKTVFYYY